MAEQRALDPQFGSRWGLGELTAAKPDAAPGVRSLDSKEFESKWMPAKAETVPRYDTNTMTSAAVAGIGGALEGIPIIGPSLNAFTEKAAAGLRTLTHGGSYGQNLNAITRYGQESKEDHPIAATAGELIGSVGSMVGAGGIPIVARGLGMTGPLLARIARGGASNALIGGADAAVRNGGDLTASGVGAGMGGLFGVGAPLAGKALGAGANYMLRPSRDAVTNRLLAVANQEGIPIGAAQASPSPWLQKLSQIAGQFPGSGQRAFQGEQVSAFTRAVGRTFGEDTELLTPQVMQAAKSRLGKEFDLVAANTTINADQQFANDLLRIAGDAKNVLSESELKPLYNNLNNIISKAKTGQIDGDTYQALTKTGSPLERVMHSADSNVKYYAEGIRDALDDAMHRSATPEMADRLAQARYQYKNMMTVAPLVVKGIPGEVNPLALQAKVNSSFSNRAFSGGGDLGDISDVGQRFFRYPSESGTPMGSLVVDQIMRHGNALAAASVAGALGGGYMMGYEPADMAKGALGLGAGALLARGATSVLNQPQSVNRLMSRTPYVAPYLNAPARNMLMAPAAQPDER